MSSLWPAMLYAEQALDAKDLNAVALDGSNNHIELVRNTLLQHVTLVALTDDTKDWQAELILLNGQDLKAIEQQASQILKRLYDFWQLTESMPSQASLLAQTIAIEPRAKDYLWVTNRIRFLLWLHSQDPWPTIDYEHVIRPGDQHASLIPIAKRLKQLGDDQGEGIIVDEVNPQLTPELVGVLKAFQARHGLSSDGVIGPQTLYWINQTPYQRARLLAYNFVMKTQYLRNLEPTYLLVNIPAFELVLVDKGEATLTSKVIVGRSDRQTPVLSSLVSNIVVNPAWRVPRSIVRNDLLPKIRKDGSYLAQRNFDVFDFNGNPMNLDAQMLQAEANGNFPYSLIQQPGSSNALGKYKLHFNNGFNVYLHDTPDKHLFKQSMRALSSGCIRVDKIDELAQWIANEQMFNSRQWQSLTQRDATKTQWFSLKNNVPVHLVYWTAWMTGPGLPQFRTDIYDMQSFTNDTRLSDVTAKVSL
ncbi:L,D-transpeptidase family protein [Shewanella sp. SNU WT4]|uniref:L,D-transpeptidase family protein n=1 Tax=Shewanella sp. SNU WT4 TaxID=2590015 RepID=UPI00143D4083|nr:L,D-transpeptidase family protein [Shewanella sp. SNU WT4]